MDNLSLIRDVFEPNIEQTTTRFPGWKKNYPQEYQAWLKFKNDVLNGVDGPTVPVMGSKFGKLMVAAWETAMKPKLSPPPVPTSGLLRWRPPGWNGGDVRDPNSFPGYTVVDFPQTPGNMNLSSGVDYYIRLGNPSYSSGTPNQSSTIIGGRNRVIIGGQIDAPSTNNTDDIRPIIIDSGDLGAITHLEGVKITSANGITLRTGQMVQIEYCWIDVYCYHDDGNTNGVHSDIIQTWGTQGLRIRTDRLTGYSDYTGLSCLASAGPDTVADPITWDRYNIDIHAKAPQPGSVSPTLPLIMGACMYPSSGSSKSPGVPSHTYTTYNGDNLWVETGYFSPTGRRKLDDVSGYTDFNTYRLRGPDGALYNSPVDATGGSGSSSTPANLGARQGDWIEWIEPGCGLLGERWYFGIAPTSAGAVNAAGNFVDPNRVGLNYVPVGYAV